MTTFRVYNAIVTCDEAGLAEHITFYKSTNQAKRANRVARAPVLHKMPAHSPNGCMQEHIK